MTVEFIGGTAAKIPAAAPSPAPVVPAAPSARRLDQMTAEHPRAGASLHLLEVAGLLVDAPVARAGDEQDGTSMVRPENSCELGVRRAGGAAAIPLQPALKAGAGELRAVDGEFVVGQPFARRDLGRRRHFGRDGLGHALVADP